MDKLLYYLKDISLDYKLTIIGKGSDEERCKNISTELDLNDKVIFQGFVSNVDEYYKQTDIVIFPSTWQEPFGLVGIEAFSFSKPVIAFNNGGISEWLINNYNGYIVDEHISSQFRNRIELLHNDRKLLRTLSKNAYESSLKFSKQSYTKSMNDILEKV